SVNVRPSLDMNAAARREDGPLISCRRGSGSMAVPFDGQIFPFTHPKPSPKTPPTGCGEVARLPADRDALEPAAGPGPRLDGARAGVPKGLRVRRESALAAAPHSSPLSSRPRTALG